MKEDLFFQQANYKTLFQTDAWRTAWLDTWQDTLRHSKNATIDPELDTYSIKHWVKKIIPLHSSYVFGQPAPGIRSIRSEYFRPPANDHWLACAVSNKKNQLVFADLPKRSPGYAQIRALAVENSQRLIEKNASIAYSVNCEQDDYDTYLKALGSNTRLKLYNRRNRLTKEGDVTIENMWPNYEAFIDLLNEFHQVRWGKPCFQGKNLAFIKTLLPLLEQEGHDINLSVLNFNNQPVSLLLDIKVGSRVYNLQAGFIESLVKGVSLGTLHFGYQIERAFSDTKTTTYDFMAGEGKNSNYKAKIANQSCELCDVVIVSSCLLKMLYVLNQWRYS